MDFIIGENLLSPLTLSERADRGLRTHVGQCCVPRLSTNQKKKIGRRPKLIESELKKNVTTEITEKKNHQQLLQLKANKSEKLEEIDRFLDMYNLLKLSHEDKEN